ncbi:hypothetical protein D3C85_1188480 [compost metagenome]
MFSNEKIAVCSRTGTLGHYSRLLKPAIEFFRCQGHRKTEDLPRPGEQLHGRAVLRVQVDMGG